MSFPEIRAESRLKTLADAPLVCFSHLRWDFVYQRPQHLLSRCAANRRVFFLEEPVFEEGAAPHLRMRQAGNVTTGVPILPPGADAVEAQRELIEKLLADEKIDEFIAWYYTPMALLFTRGLHPRVTVFDVMDQLSAFHGAPPELLRLEQELFAKADVVFTGGRSLYLAKRGQHRNVHLFPSSVDRAHFAKARRVEVEPEDQRGIAHPRVGFFGVLDERLDRELLRETAALLPEWQFVLIGPVVKIAEEELPRAANIHYLGGKSYAALPEYIGFWDVAMLPFAMNASTEFISPTKTPEYLAAGKPVVSTPVRDVVYGYGDKGLVTIASTAEEFAAAIVNARQGMTDAWQAKVDEVLQQESWDALWRAMWRRIEEADGPLEESDNRAAENHDTERAHV